MFSEKDFSINYKGDYLEIQIFIINYRNHVLFFQFNGI
jgi:hypothetical protein